MTLRIRFRFDDPWIHFSEMLAGEPSNVEAVFQTMPIAKLRRLQRRSQNYGTFSAAGAELTNTDRSLCRFGANMGDFWQSPQPLGQGALELAWIDREFVFVEDAAQVPNDQYDKSTGDLQRPPSLMNEALLSENRHTSEWPEAGVDAPRA